MACLSAPVAASAQVFPIPPIPSHVIVDACSGCGGAVGSTIGLAVPSLATPIAVTDTLGLLAYPKVDLAGNLLVAVTGAGSGGTSSVDGAAFAAGVSAGTAVIGARDDTASGTIAEDKLGIVRITTNRAEHVNLRDDAGTEIGIAASPLQVLSQTEVDYLPIIYTNTAGLNLTVKAEDQNSTGGDSGIVALAVRQDTPAGSTSADGDYTWLKSDSLGRLWTNGSGVTQPVSGTFFQATQPVSGTFWQATQPVSGTVTTVPPANASTNVAQLAGTTTDTNSGSKSAGTLRVVLATDQPALTNKLLVTPDSVALPANQSVNVAQLAGTATDTNSGSKSAGTLRVVLATDQPALTNKLLVTPDSVALPANQSVNMAQVAGVATSTGNGTAAGSIRVSVASDSTGNIATIGTSITPGTAAANLGKAEDAGHATADTGVMNLGVRQDTTSTQITSAALDYSPYAVDAFGTQYVRQDSPNRVKCFIDSSATVATVVTGCAAPGASLAIYITDISFYNSIVSTTANRNLIVTGTGGTCGTGQTNLWAGYNSAVFSGSEAHFSTPLRATTNGEVCFLDAGVAQKVVTISGFIAP